MPGEPMCIENAPSIEGLTFRHFRGEADYPAMARLIAVTKTADGVERTDTVETIANGYRHLNNCDPFIDMCFAVVDDEPIAYSRVWWERQEDGQHTYIPIGFVDPLWRRHGIGQTMLSWNERRLRVIAQGHDARPKILRSFADGNDDGNRALLQGSGYVPVTFGAEMSRSILGELPEAPLPEGLEVRPVEPSQLRQIWEADTEAFRDHWGARPPTEADWEGFLDRPFTDITLWKVAWEGDRVVGQVRSFINTDENEEYGRLRGYTENISTMKEWRGKGVARALICESMRLLRERGMEEVGLGVHTENPTGAFHLYSSLSYQVHSKSTVFEKPLD
jgi:mycothiol synthase